MHTRFTAPILLKTFAFSFSYFHIIITIIFPFTAAVLYKIETYMFEYVN